MKRYAVIMAGGKGERFWPLSNSRCPKQFLSLVGESTLLSLAVDRLEGLVSPECVFVITNAEFIDVARKAAPQLPSENVIGEVVGRDTAAAVALGAALVGSRDPEGVFAVLTADHIMGDLDVFRRTLEEGMDLASQEDVLVTIGLEPQEASTGFGYIECGAELKNAAGTTAFYNAERFVEKPDIDTARSYLEAGNYFWNSGMFVWSVLSISQAFASYRPPLFEMIQELTPLVNSPNFGDAAKRWYLDLDKISIDYAVMEKARNVVMARGTFAWDDVGSWPALENHFNADSEGNINLGRVALHDAKNNIVYSKDRLTALVGVADLIVVQADGVTLVCPKDRAQDVKPLLNKMRATGQFEDVL